MQQWLRPVVVATMAVALVVLPAEARKKKPPTDVSPVEIELPAQAGSTPAADATAQPTSDPASSGQLPATQAATAAAIALTSVASWGYQLKGVDVRAIAASPYDLVVVDFANDGKKGKAASVFSRADVERMQRKPDGSRRLVLAYLSIGEAETYRYYWNPAWSKEGAPRPAWLGEENDSWRDNFLVKFWYPEWKNVIYAGANSYLDLILAAGFDGVYLDRADVAFHWEQQGEKRVKPRAEIIEFVAQLSKTAKTKAATTYGRQQPFYVIAQNAEELLDEPRYQAAIDGIAKEDLLFGIEADEIANAAPEVAYSSGQLAKAKAARKLVLVVEYARNPELVGAARKQIDDLGFVPFFAPRSLEWLAVNPRRMARAPVESERRIALVIGNSAYAALPALTSPASDTAAMAAALRRLGFAEVTERRDLDLAALKSEIKAFGTRAKSADWAVVFFAGHGFEYDGVNYLAPVDLKLSDEDEADDQALPLSELLDKVKLARKLGVVILDASRDLDAGKPAAATAAPSPPKEAVSQRRAGSSPPSSIAAPPLAPNEAAPESPPGRLEVGKGFAPIDAPRRVMIASAARHSTTTADAGASSSPYVSALLARIETPDLEIGTLLANVRQAVLERTGGTQAPHTYSALPIDYFFFKSRTAATSSEAASTMETGAPQSDDAAAAAAPELQPDDPVPKKRRRRN